MSSTKDIVNIFGSNVFNDKLMKERLPKEVYKSLKRTVNTGATLSAEAADVIAASMRDWALEKGASHYTHWFQPLTGSTAEKHDSFISPNGNGSAILEFGGTQLIQGEPDASSFPSGGLRTTFEARGYTAWDCTSPAFLKKDAVGDVTLCIPTAFCSYTGEALDKKTPLLRSMEAVSKQAIRVLRALGNKDAERVFSTVGPEQEYFLIDKKHFEQRLDLVTSGRTLFGAPAPKGQEMEDQYFGAIRDRIAAFMKELDVELWRMGVAAKTKHNEVAPSQFEMATVYSTTNIAADHNQLVMETMKKVALRHGLVCLLHEKPFDGVNGSGKHNNWSLATDDGQNLLEPGKTPHQNEQFLVFLSAVINAIDLHADKLRASAANTGNDLRLGANEAPPAIISIFMGTQLTEILNCIASGKKYSHAGQTFLNIGADTLPELPRDNTDRNRTSPFAFTGNKFEFRMMPSSASVSGANVVLNTIAAEALDKIATRLEKAKKKDINKVAAQIIRETIKKNGRVIFNGNNYSDEWVKIAKKRGLPNIKNTPAALPYMNTPEAVKLFSKYSVLSKGELASRYEIYLEQYCKTLNIEALAAVDMVKRQYLPVAFKFAGELADVITKLKSASTTAPVQKDLLKQVTALTSSISEKVSALETANKRAQNTSDLEAASKSYRDKVKKLAESLRQDVDTLETITPARLWPVPTYAQMLFQS